jgi:hypothetical protein
MFNFTIQRALRKYSILYLLHPCRVYDDISSNIFNLTIRSALRKYSILYLLHPCRVYDDISSNMFNLTIQSALRKYSILYLLTHVESPSRLKRKVLQALMIPSQNTNSGSCLGSSSSCRCGIYKFLTQRPRCNFPLQ